MLEFIDFSVISMNTHSLSIHWFHPDKLIQTKQPLNRIWKCKQSKRFTVPMMGEHFKNISSLHDVCPKSEVFGANVPIIVDFCTYFPMTHQMSKIF